ncbi:glycosyltransferase family 39 protein [Alicyclobacillus sp.]|uniref:ArnT family glycosyltransferase n=1 Tax=Alicyclobacillus sp. TaxID=61169 RepID=UPI0025C40BDC|nr:glycosyltransferase family 39 protein [Alicyclobacillus sp.]MCL6516043.1 glycosyltransferase family 39 protein [Alicyclobacillus sp.]
MRSPFFVRRVTQPSRPSDFHTPPNARGWWPFVLIVIAAIAARLVWLGFVHPMPATDFAWYEHQAIHLLRGEGYRVDGHPTAYFPIGYPLFLAGVYGIAGVGWWSGVLANVLLNALTAGLVYRLGERLHGRGAGLCGGLSLALYPPHIAWSSVLCSEMLFTLLFTWTALWWIRRPAPVWGWRCAAVSGILTGLACIVRPVGLLLPVALWLYLLSARAGWRRAMGWAVTAAVFMALTVAPVTWRNWVTLRALVPVSTNGGVNLWQGNNPRAIGEYFWPADPRENPFLNYVHDEVRENREAEHAALQYIEHHPGRTIALGFVKWRNLFRGVDNAYFWSVGHSDPPVSPGFALAAHRLGLWAYRMLIALAAIGLILQARAMRRSGDLRPLAMWWMFAYYVGLFFVFPAWDRMRVPIDPWLACWASVALMAGIRRFGRRRGAGP